MSGYFHHTAHVGAFADLADWEPIPGSPAGVLSQPDKYIRVAGEGGVTDGIVTVGTYHFDPTKWYRVTVEMDIDPLKQNLDGDGGQFNIEGAGHHWDMMNLMLGWGIAGEIDPDPQPVQTLIIHPGTAEENAKIRVVSMGIAGDPIEIVMIRIEQFDHDPNIIAPAFHTPLQSLIHLAVGEPLPEFHIKLHFTNNPTSYSLVNFPDGTSVDNEGHITGTPTTVQTKNDAHVVATNAAGSAQSNAMRFEIVAAGITVPPAYNGNIEPITAVVGEAFSLDVHHHWGLGGPVSSYTLQNAPTGMVISNVGVITWPSPTKVTVTGVTVTGTNTGGDAVSNTFGVSALALGPELAPPFTACHNTGDDWRCAPPFIASAGEAIATEAKSNVKMSLYRILKTGVSYFVSYEIKSIAKGAFVVGAVGASLDTGTLGVNNAPGIYSGIITQSVYTHAGDCAIRTSGTTTGVISSISIREVLP